MKLLIEDGDIKVGIHYQETRGVLVVGGKCRHDPYILKVIALFGLKSHNRKVNKRTAKLKYRMPISAKKWQDGYKAIIDKYGDKVHDMGNCLGRVYR